MPNYRVVFHEETERAFDIPNCHTPEEAEAIADDLYEEELGSLDRAGIQNAASVSTQTVATEVEEIEDEL